MNEAHLAYLGSPRWAQELRSELLPWLESTSDLDGDILEIGPGPGLTTDLLRKRARHVTAVEIDGALADDLRARLEATNVDVLHLDAAALPIPAKTFTAATCFSVLHHVASVAAQDAIFAEITRVLRPGAKLFAVDSLDLDVIRDGHVGDTFVPIDPETLPARLMAAGLHSVKIERSSPYQFRFAATR